MRAPARAACAAAAGADVSRPPAPALRVANESTARRAVLYSVLEAVGLVTVSVGQVLFVKRLFDSKHSRKSSSPRFGTASFSV